MEFCRNCKWYEQWTGVCCNPDSDMRTDFTDEKYSCEEWEEKH